MSKAASVAPARLSAVPNFVIPVMMNVRVGPRSFGEPEEQRLHPKKRAPADDRNTAASTHVLHGAGGSIGPPGSVDRVHGMNRPDQMVPNDGELGGRWLPGADVESFVDLNAVGADYLAAEPLCEGKGQGTLARRRGTHDDQEVVGM